jgi:chemotaxis protein CheC
MEELGDFEIDALRETANIGTGNATIALSALLNKKVDIALPKNIIVEAKDVYSHVVNEKGTVFGLYTQVKEGISGNILLLFPSSSSFKLLSQISNTNITEKKVLDNHDMELLRKLGSVLCAAYLNALSKFFEQKIIYEQPKIISTIGDSVADFIIAQIGESEKVMLITVDFAINDVDISGGFVLLFTLKSLTPLLDKLKKKMGVA